MLIFPQGILSLVAAFFSGILISIVAVAITIFIGFYKLTHPEPPCIDQQHSPHGIAPSSSITTTTPTHHLNQNNNSSSSSSARDVTLQGQSMPHSYAHLGMYNGIIYTVPLSQWSRDRSILDWPPHPPLFSVWRATVTQGTLVLGPIITTPTPSEATPPQEIGIPLQGCAIELVRDGLQGRSEMIRRAPLLVVHPSCPLMHGERGFWMFASEPASKQQWFHALIYWCGIASTPTSNTSTINNNNNNENDDVCIDSKDVQRIEALYDEYCTLMKQQSELPYLREVKRPLIPSQNSTTTSADATNNNNNHSNDRAGMQEAGSKSGGTKKQWRRFRGSKNTQQQQQPQHLVPVQHAAPPIVNRHTESVQQPVATTRGIPIEQCMPPALATDKLATTGHQMQHQHLTKVHTPRQRPPPTEQQQQHHEQMNSTVSTPVKSSASTPDDDLLNIESIIEQRWMQSRKIPVPSPPPKRKGGIATPSRSAAPSPHPSPTKSLIPSSTGLPPGTPREAAHLPENGNASTAILTSADAAAVDPRPPLNEAPSSSSLDGADSPPLLQPLSLLPTSQQPSQQQQQPSQHQPHAVLPVTPVDLKKNLNMPRDFPPLVSSDHFFNMMSTRIFFDLLRNPAFSEHVRARIQKTMSRLHTPSYVHSLEVISVDPGCTAPTISNMHALPMPGNEIWPQLILDVKYKGNFTVILECKVDVRDSTAWMRIDETIDKIEGKKNSKREKKGMLSRNNNNGGNQSSFSDEESNGNDDDERILLDDGDNDGDATHLDAPLQGDVHACDTSTSTGTALKSTRHGETGNEGDENDGGSSGNSLTHADDDDKIDDGDKNDNDKKNHRPRRKFIGMLRRQTAKGLRKMAESTATHIANLPIRVNLSFTLLEGTLSVWIPPPPGDRLFWSFLTPPNLSINSTPTIGSRKINSGFAASRVSAWIQKRIEFAFKKNLVFPGGGDIPLPLLLNIENPRAVDDVPGLRDMLSRTIHLRRGGRSASMPSSAPTSPSKLPQGQHV